MLHSWIMLAVVQSNVKLKALAPCTVTVPQPMDGGLYANWSSHFGMQTKRYHCAAFSACIKDTSISHEDTFRNVVK